MTSKGRYSSCAVYNTCTCQPPGGGRWRLLSPDAGHEPSLGPLPRLLARRRLRGRLPRRRFRIALPKAKLAEVLPGHQVRVHATLQVPLGEPLALQGVTLLPLEASEIVRGELKATRGEREGNVRTYAVRASVGLGLLTVLHSPKWSSGNTPFSGAFAATPRDPPKAAAILGVGLWICHRPPLSA